MLILDSNLGMVCLTETRLALGDDIKIRCYNTAHEPKNTHGGGVAILVKEGIAYDLVHVCDIRETDVTGNTDLLGVKLLAPGGTSPLFLILIYYPPGSEPNDSEFLSKLFDFSRTNTHIMFLGDLNAHAPLW